MPIQRGEPWGEPVEAVPGLRLVRHDGSASETVAVALAAGAPMPELALAGGDLARTMGGGSVDRFASGNMVVRAPVDLWRVESDHWSGWSVAHVVARGRWWRGPVAMAMNAQYLGAYDVAPRSHPHDGFLDLIEVDAVMPWRARWQARARARTGTHLPHPSLHSTRRSEWVATFERPLGMWVDGIHRGVTRTVRVTLHPHPLVVLA